MWDLSSALSKNFHCLVQGCVCNIQHTKHTSHTGERSHWTLCRHIVQVLLCDMLTHVTVRHTYVPHYLHGDFRTNREVTLAWDISERSEALNRLCCWPKMWQQKKSCAFLCYSGYFLYIFWQFCFFSFIYSPRAPDFQCRRRAPDWAGWQNSEFIHWHVGRKAILASWSRYFLDLSAFTHHLSLYLRKILLHEKHTIDISKGIKWPSTFMNYSHARCLEIHLKWKSLALSAFL